MIQTATWRNLFNTHKTRRQMGRLCLAIFTTLTIAGCGGGSDSGSGQDTSANAGNYDGSITRLTLDGRALPVSAGDRMLGSLDNSGNLRLTDGLGWVRNTKINGNTFSKQTNNVGSEVDGIFCIGPEFVTGNLSGTTIRGQIENRIQCDGQGRTVVLIANFKIDRTGPVIARAKSGDSAGSLSAVDGALRTIF